MDSEAGGSRRPAAMTPSRNRRRRRMKYEGRIVIMAIMAGLPGSLVALIFLWLRDPTPQARTQWTLTVLIVGLWLGFAMAVRDRVVFPLQTISNLLSALREGDFSVRGRGRVRRRTGRSHAGGQHAGRHAARTAAGRLGGHHAAAHRDVGDRRGRVRLRP